MKVRITAIPFDDTFIRIDGGTRARVPWVGELTPGKHVVTAICEGISEPYELRTELVVDGSSGAELKAAWRCKERAWFRPDGGS